jgi:hypothetical protein
MATNMDVKKLVVEIDEIDIKWRQHATRLTPPQFPSNCPI